MTPWASDSQPGGSGDLLTQFISHSIQGGFPSWLRKGGVGLGKILHLVYQLHDPGDSTALRGSPALAWSFP
jgi:hypothetical protein